MEKHKSVRTKIVAVVFLSVLLTAFLCVAVNVYNFSRYYREAVDAKLDASAQNVVKAINDILKSGALGSSALITDWIGRECEKTKSSDKDIAYLAVTDAQGFVHYHTSSRFMKSTFKAPGDVIDKSYPLKTDKENFGFLHIAIERSTINKKINAFILGGGLISFAILCLIIPMAYGFVSNTIIKPLKRISAMLTDIAEGDGDLTRRLERVETHDEFEVVAKKFNKFVDKIQDTVAKVRDSSQSVSRSADELYKKTEEMKNIIANSAFQRWKVRNGWGWAYIWGKK